MVDARQCDQQGRSFDCRFSNTNPNHDSCGETTWTSKKRDQVKEAMREDIRLGRQTPVGLRDMLEKDLVADYGVSRETARKARDAVLSEMPPRTELPSASATST
jgi:Bacterial regulatory proteins, gntR family